MHKIGIMEDGELYVEIIERELIQGYEDISCR